MPKDASMVSETFRAWAADHVPIHEERGSVGRIGTIARQEAKPSRGHRNLLKLIGQLWQGLREWCGDAAYEKYVRGTDLKTGERLLSRTEFYVEQLNRRYSRPNRCC